MGKQEGHNICRRAGEPGDLLAEFRNDSDHEPPLESGSWTRPALPTMLYPIPAQGSTPSLETESLFQNTAGSKSEARFFFGKPVVEEPVLHYL